MPIGKNSVIRSQMSFDDARSIKAMSMDLSVLVAARYEINYLLKLASIF